MVSRKMNQEEQAIVREMLLQGKTASEIVAKTGLLTVSGINKYRARIGVPVLRHENGVLQEWQADRANICWDCGRACGNCPWSEWDVEEKKQAFRPVPGWQVEEYYEGGRLRQQIVSCPLFVEDVR